jgi:hypothetical protein
MKTRDYLCEGEFSYIQKSYSPESVRKSLLLVIKRAGLNEKNFIVKINRVDQNYIIGEVPQEKSSITPVGIESSKTILVDEVKPKKSLKSSAKKSIKHKVAVIKNKKIVKKKKKV